jgi:hypothetical protein
MKLPSYYVHVFLPSLASLSGNNGSSLNKYIFSWDYLPRIARISSEHSNSINIKQNIINGSVDLEVKAEGKKKSKVNGE